MGGNPSVVSRIAVWGGRWNSIWQPCEHSLRFWTSAASIETTAHWNLVSPFNSMLSLRHMGFYKLGYPKMYGLSGKILLNGWFGSSPILGNHHVHVSSIWDRPISSHPRRWQEAHDPELGARPLKRYLERHLVSRCSNCQLGLCCVLHGVFFGCFF